jgi:N-methylhydantoinase A
MRYGAQSFTIPVDVTECVAAKGGPADYAAAFHAEHERLFGHRDDTSAVAVDELRVRTVGRQPKPRADAGNTAAAHRARPRGCRSVRIGGTVHPAASVFARSALAPGATVEGPAIIEQDVATVLVPPGYVARAGALGDLVLVRE